MISYPYIFKKILKSNFYQKIDPYKLTLAITYQCNSRCQNCGIWKKKIGDELSLEEIDKIFSQYRKSIWVDLTGGEIFLRKDIFEIVKTIKQRSKNLYLLHFPTNGLMPDLIFDKVQKISNLKIKNIVVSVSLDGPKFLHDNLRGVTGNFEKAIQTFQLLKTLKNIKVFFGFTASKYNAGRLKDTFQTLKKEIPNLSWKDFHVNIAHTSKNYYNNEDLDIKSNKDNLIKEISEYQNLRKFKISPISFIENIYLKLIPQYLQSNQIPLPCKSISTSVFIDPQGKVFPCTMMNETLGNLREYNYDLNKILNLENTNKVLNNIKNKQCPMCWTPCEAYQTILGNLKKII